MGTPSVIVGDRQIGREHGNNILFSTYDHKDIIKKINMQISNKLKNKNQIFLVMVMLQNIFVKKLKN